MTQLFEPLTLRGTEIGNRIWLAPMCQYSCEAEDGMPGPWHLVHLGSRAQGGFGLILTEASAVVPEGRISPQDAGTRNDEQAESWSAVVAFVHSRAASSASSSRTPAARPAPTGPSPVSPRAACPNPRADG